MDDAYSKDLIKKLNDVEQWIPNPPSDEFLRLSQSVTDESQLNTVSSKIAVILVHHQIMHELTKTLIHLSTLLVQGELWPTKFTPLLDGGKEKMTGWYLEYLKNNCINFESNNKDKYLEVAMRLNSLRNKVTHELTGKNEVIIGQTYREFERLYERLQSHYLECENWLLYKLQDLTIRVDFDKLMEQAE